jgi:hypothetical protein
MFIIRSGPIGGGVAPWIGQLTMVGMRGGALQQAPALDARHSIGMMFARSLRLTGSSSSLARPPSLTPPPLFVLSFNQSNDLPITT